MSTNMLTLAELKSLIGTMYGSTAIASQNPAALLNETAKVLNKIGLMVTIKGRYVDRLPELDGPELPLGKTIEEYFLQLPKILAEDRDGSEDGTPNDPSFLPASWSYSLPKKRIKQTRRYDEFEEACYTEAQFLDFIADIEASINDATTVYRYGLKRQLIGEGIELVESIIDATAGATAKDGKTVATYVAASAASLDQGAYVISPTDSTVKGVVMAEKGNIANNTSWDDAVAAGKITVFQLAESIAKPTDSSSGEAFIKKVLDDVEIASENSMGHSLNGATIGAVEDLRLYTLQGLRSVIAVDVKAGAFHRDELELGAAMKSLPDFGDYAGDTWAVLTDSRTLVLFLGYMAMRVRENADGDFVNFVRHMRHTPFVSRATYIKLYREPEPAPEAVVEGN